MHGGASVPPSIFSLLESCASLHWSTAHIPGRPHSALMRRRRLTPAHVSNGTCYLSIFILLRAPPDQPGCRPKILSFGRAWRPRSAFQAAAAGGRQLSFSGGRSGDVTIVSICPMESDRRHIGSRYVQGARMLSKSASVAGK